MEKTVKRGRGHKIGPGEAALAERKNRIELHRQRITENSCRIRRAGFDPHNTPIEEMLDAGVILQEYRDGAPAAELRMQK